MLYPKVEYVDVQVDGYRELYCFDGTYRGVIFRDERSASAAMRPGRAELDAAAIEKGFLPLGASLVSRAGASDRDDDPALRPDFATDPLGQIRAKFSASLLAARSEWISAESDLAAKSRQADAYARYCRSAGACVRD